MLSRFRHYQQQVNRLASHRVYWIGLFLLSLGMLGVALFYQYALDEWPCIMCIQVRLWLSLLAVVSLVMIVFPSHRYLRHFCNLLVLVTAVGMAERSYLLLGTERGFVFRDCGFDLGLPSWLALDKWLPGVFRVDASCGYTPELLLGITMAEALMVFSVVFTVVALLVMVSAMMSARQS